MKGAKLYIITCLLVVILVLSCTKVININLNSSDPRLIIESSISDQPSSCYVSLSMSVNYNEPNTFPAVTEAKVNLSDDTGNNYNLIQFSPGIYTIKNFKGIPGKTYTLSVTASGRTYSATSKMPDPVEIDTIYQDFFLRGFRGGGEIKFVVVQYKDPGGRDNYYRFVEKINKTATNAIFLDDDLLRDGNEISQNIIRTDPSLNTGDSVRIFLLTIDKNVYNYFLQLREVTSSYGGQTATPANPVSNFNNGALGYFSAYAVRSKSIVIK